MYRYVTCVGLVAILSLSSLFSQSSSPLTNSTFLHFDSDEATIDAEDRITLRDLILNLERHSDYSISVIGHTDQDGSDSYNETLAKRRALSVTNYLVGLGFPEHKLNQDWKGEKELANHQLSTEAKQENRRVELKYSYFDFETVDELATEVSTENKLSQHYTVGQEARMIDLDKGASLYIPDQAFVHLDGSPVMEQVEIEVKEAYQLTDFIAHDLYTESKSDLLETGGMLYINATAGGQQLKLAENRQLEIIYPVQNLEEGMELFYAVETETGMTWVPTGTPLTTTQVKNNPLDIDLNPILNYEMGKLEKPELKFEKMPVRPSFGHMPLPPSDRIYSAQKYKEVYKKYEVKLQEWKDREPLYLQEMEVWNGIVNQRLKKIEVHRQALLEVNYKIKFITALQGLQRMENRRAPSELIQRMFAFMNHPMRINLDDRKIYKSAFQNYARGIIEERKLETRDEGYLIYPKKTDFCSELRARIFEAEKYAAELRYKETGLIDRKGFGSYVAGISKLGWINCDKYTRGGYELTELKVVEVAPETRHYLIYKDIRSLISPRKAVGEVTFVNVPVGEEVKLVALKLVDEKPQMAIKEMKVDYNGKVVLDFFPTDLEQIREELNSVDKTVKKEAAETYDLSLNVYPNPTTLEFTAVAEPRQKLSSLAMYDLNGALMKSIPAREQQEQDKISVADFENGVYVVTATYNNGRVTSERIVVQN